jgi:hypothetical protein
VTNILLARGSPAARGKVDTVRYFRTDFAPVLTVKAECISVAGMLRYPKSFVTAQFLIYYLLDYSN